MRELSNGNKLGGLAEISGWICFARWGAAVTLQHVRAGAGQRACKVASLRAELSSVARVRVVGRGWWLLGTSLADMPAHEALARPT